MSIPSPALVTDHEILEKAFGPGYFIFSRIRNKLTLTADQQAVLDRLVDERNHFEILDLVISLRKASAVPAA